MTTVQSPLLQCIGVTLHRILLIDTLNWENPGDFAGGV